jgi:hypothetical protein
MSLIYADSFDTYSVLQNRYDTVNNGGVNGTPKIETAAARNGPQGMLINEFVAAYTPFVRKNFTSRAPEPGNTQLRRRNQTARGPQGGRTARATRPRHSTTC